MSDKDKSSPIGTVTEEESRLLSAFLDGELRTSKHNEIRERLDSGEEALLKEYQLLKEARSAARGWHRELGLDEKGAAKKVDLWERIEGDIAEGYLESGYPLSQKIFDTIVDFFGSPALGPAFAGVALVLYLGLNPSIGGDSGSSTDSSLANNSSGQVIDGVRTVSTGAPLRSGLSDPAYVAFQKELQRLRMRSARSRGLNSGRSPLVIPVVPVIERNFAQGGLRSQGADIDWIKANRDFNLYHSKDRSDPPVIWVARNGRKAAIQIGNGRTSREVD